MAKPDDTVYRVAADHPVPLASGRVVAPGDHDFPIDPKDDHDKALVAEGLLIQAEKEDSK